MWRRSSRKPAPPFGRGLPSKATTSPGSTVSDTSSSTRFAPKRLRMPLKAKSGIDFPLQPKRQERQRPADGEVKRGDDGIHHHGLKRDIDDELTGTRKLDKTDDRRDGCSLD